MMKKIFFIYILILFIISSLFGYCGYKLGLLNKQKDQNISNLSKIELEEKKCIENSHVYNYFFCVEKSEKAWDNEIRKTIISLKEVMSEEEYNQVIKMHKEWEKSVITQTHVINRFISQKDGLIYQTIGINHISNLKKEYAQLLKSIYFNYLDKD